MRGYLQRRVVNLSSSLSPLGHDNGLVSFRVLAQVELDFNSIERIGEYLSVQQEAPLVIENSRPPAYWPSSTSGIIVEDLWIRYSSNSPDVLKGLSFKIEPGEKIGVVGRTGSGKTTLCAALLRMVECWRGRIM